MRQGLIGGVVVLGMLALTGSGLNRAAEEQKGPGWLNDYEAARAAARKSGKPILLVFR